MVSQMATNMGLIDFTLISSILGVNVNCTDDEIKRYYRRQAFLVHPDKNQQPGAEEAFKILQHAFDLIGEPVSSTSIFFLNNPALILRYLVS